MGGVSNLRVNVEELNTCASKLNSVCEKLDDVIVSVVQELQTASKTGLESGQAAESFSTFVNEFSKLNGKLLEFG